MCTERLFVGVFSKVLSNCNNNNTWEINCTASNRLFSVCHEPNHQPLDCFFNSLFGLTTRQNQGSAILVLPVMRTAFPFHHVTTDRVPRQSYQSTLAWLDFQTILCLSNIFAYKYYSWHMYALDFILIKADNALWKNIGELAHALLVHIRGMLGMVIHPFGSF